METEPREGAIAVYNLNWMDMAKCADDPMIQGELHEGRYDRFADENESTQKRNVIRYCDDCPVRRDCLEYALWIDYGNHGITVDGNAIIAAGVWGGTTRRQRAQIHHSRMERKAKTLQLLERLTGQPMVSDTHNASASAGPGGTESQAS